MADPTGVAWTHSNTHPCAVSPTWSTISSRLLIVDSMRAMLEPPQKLTNTLEFTVDGKRGKLFVNRHLTERKFVTLERDWETNVLANNLFIAQLLKLYIFNL